MSRDGLNDKRSAGKVPTPGQVIRRELEQRRWSQEDLAAIMGRPTQVISEIVNGRKQITVETARELAHALGTSAEQWLNLEASYRLHLVEQSGPRDDVAQRAELYRSAPVLELQKRGWLPDVRDAPALSQALRDYMQVPLPGHRSAAAAVLRYSAQAAPEQQAELAWLRRVEWLARQQKVVTSPDLRWGELVSAVLGLSEREEDVARVPDLLLGRGVHFVLVPQLSRTYLDGAATWVEGQPLVALTLRFDRIDAFWLTLMHELAHLALGHTGTWLDRLCDVGSRAPRKGPEARLADHQARDWLLPAGAVARFRRQAAPDFGRPKVVAFAKQERRHPGIVVGRLHLDGLVDPVRMRSLLVRVKPYLEQWLDAPGAR